jgi:NAD+--dinitrogen-reductase ADP-D-ribosyltransferase
MRSQGLYGTNALEAQFDLVYTFCQLRTGVTPSGRSARHALPRRQSHGRPRSAGQRRRRRHVILFNNLSSFTCSRERAGEFGDYILAVEVPLTKIFFHCGLLPGVLQGEDEFLVIGGVVDVILSTM